MTDPVVRTEPLGFPWGTSDPFLFCVHHDDAYPAGNAGLGPAASLVGRELGMDFAGKDGWRMYHGHTVPGFPAHPHRGFETVTVVRKGLIDHSDSLGAAARFGGGDTQWMTAGKGIVHSEMFPLVHQDKANPLELFQIWLNLPREDKFVDPHFAMLWGADIPHVHFRDAEGRGTEVTVVAGRLGEAVPPPPPPKSWASRPDTDVAVWAIRLEPGARWTLPAAGPGTDRSLYFFEGDSVTVGGRTHRVGQRLVLAREVPVELVAGATPVELLLLQGRPIGQPVVAHGPFVMNTPGEIRQAMVDYHTTQFGGWPWPSHAPVHPPEQGRFARHIDGRVEAAPEDAP